MIGSGEVVGIDEIPNCDNYEWCYKYVNWVEVVDNSNVAEKWVK